MATKSIIYINGVRIETDGPGVVSIHEDGKVFVDGIEKHDLGKEKLKVSIKGNVHTLQVFQGDVDVKGNVTGDVNAGNCVRCGDVGGNVNAGNSVECKDVGGGVDAGNSVKCNEIKGSAEAGNKIIMKG